jgi:4-hydroxybenzoate polyprenyltransferase
LAAVALLYTTDVLANTSYSSWHLYSIAFFATILTYNWQRLLSYNKRKQYASSQLSEWISGNLWYVYASSVVAGIMCAYNFFNLWPNQQAGLVLLGIISVVYALPILPSSRGWIRLRDIGVTKPVVLGITWGLVTAWLPLIIPDDSYFALNVDERSWFLIAARSLMVIALCVPFDVKDMAFDRATMAYPTLPVKFGVPKSNIIAVVFSLVSLAVFIAWASLEGGGAILMGAAIISTLINCILLIKVKETSPEWYFSLALDGLMVLHAILLVAGMSLEIWITVRDIV